MSAKLWVTAFLLFIQVLYHTFTIVYLSSAASRMFTEVACFGLRISILWSRLSLSACGVTPYDQPFGSDQGHTTTGGSLVTFTTSFLDPRLPL